MKTVWKYKLRLTDTQTIEVPKGGEILSAQSQYGDICLWVLLDPDSAKERREIEIYGTGNPIHDAERKFIGTVQLHGGSLVFHVFERNPAK